MKNGVWFLAVALVLAGCGGGGGGGSNNAATPNTRMPALTAQEIRDRATRARQNLGSVTQSTNVDGTTNVVLDLVRVKLDESGDPMFDNDGAEDRDVIMENTRQGWEMSDDDKPAGWIFATHDVYIDLPDGSYSDGTPVIDAESLTVKSSDDYQSGDYYLVTGLWYENDRNFGVFSDGPELTVSLPGNSSATYEGGALGLYWHRDQTLLGAAVFTGDVEFNAVASGGNVGIAGHMNDIRWYDPEGDPTVLLPNRRIRFREANYISPGIVGGEMVCEPNCEIQGGSWGGQFHGNPPESGETDGWPFSFNGTFGLQGVEYQDSDSDESRVLDVLGGFTSVHEELSDVIEDLRNGGFYDSGDSGGGGPSTPSPPIETPPASPPPAYEVPTPIQTTPSPPVCDPSQRELC